MRAHATDLRAEVAQSTDEFDAAAADLDAVVHAFVRDWRSAGLSSKVAALLEFAEQVNDSAHTCSERNVASLRAAGWDDAAVHDAVQVIAYFNYINRIADALGVEPEADSIPWGEDRPPL